jgi:hypothetical protein
MSESTCKPSALVWHPTHCLCEVFDETAGAGRVKLLDIDDRLVVAAVADFRAPTEQERLEACAELARRVGCEFRVFELS